MLDVIVSPKRKANKWTANIEHATLEGLKDYIRELYRPPALENDGAFTVFIEKPSKPFNEWTFPKVCELYGLSDNPNHSIDVYPIFRVDTYCNNPIDLSYEATKSIYSYTYFTSATYPFKDQIKIVPEKPIERKNGRGNLDYGIESRTTGRTIGLIEVKKDDFKQGFAQVTEMDSSLSRKRKANEIDDEYDMDKSMGDCKRCGKIILHGMYTRRCGYEDKVEKVLAHIIRLLEEAQKPIEASQSGEGSRK
ncbi:hypothetical protein GLOIN_2v1774909 [Rhizophagus irregularis DAOM 181602=DAOM 197198]|nr:hypothetical protein GLOIN_2v1774909 [Rhizophagus irregularis DAOM 181602=DAOM 197198]